MKKDFIEDFDFKLIMPHHTLEAWSQEIQIIFMLKGNGWLRMEDVRTPYSFSQEDIFVINSFQMYRIVLEDNALAISLLLSPSLIAGFCPEVESPGFRCKSFLYGEDKQQHFDRLRCDLALVFRAWYKKESELSIHMRSRIITLADNLFQNFLIEWKYTGKESGRERLRAAVDYIQRNYHENISLADLSAQTYLSVSYLSRSFPKYLGISFIGYLTQVRLVHASSLLKGGNTVTEIAYECGFASASSLIDAFKQHYGMTPGQYRRSHEKSAVCAGTEAFVEEGGFSGTFEALEKYAEYPEEAVLFPSAVSNEISADIGIVRGRLLHSWRTIINAGYARDLLDMSMQNQLVRLQKSVGFRFIRCKGILDDDMMLYTRDIYGKLSINYVYLDQAVDVILSTGAKPMLEIGHMPSAMAKNKMQAFKRPAFLSPPADLQEWQGLVRGIMDHFVGRYGIAEMKQWLFAPWISVDLQILGLYTQEEYMAVYSASYRAIKDCCSDLMTCGPGVTSTAPHIWERFLTMSREQNCIPDIFTIRSFAAVDPEEENSGLKLGKSNEAFSLAVSGDEDYMAHLLREIHSALNRNGLSRLPVMLDEWSNNIWQRDLCNDTSYKSAYLFKNILENYDSCFGMGYFNVSDQLDEIAPAAEVFHGGFGLFTRNGIPKSAYRAMQLLRKAGEKLVARGEGYFITASEAEVQIFLYHYVHYDMLYRYRNTANLTTTNRYRVFHEKQPKSYHIQLNGFRSGSHLVRRYSIGPEGGSTFDAWLAMGMPEPMTREEEERLYHQSFPEYRTETVEADDILKLKAWLQPHEIQLITISITERTRI